MEPISVLNWICGLCPAGSWLALQFLLHLQHIPRQGWLVATAGGGAGAAHGEHRRQIHWETTCTGLGHGNWNGE